MNLTIIVWSASLLTCGLFVFYKDSLHTWPGFLIDLVSWYIEEFCYYKILLHFCTLEFAYATWMLKNFKEDGKELKDTLT